MKDVMSQQEVDALLKDLNGEDASVSISDQQNQYDLTKQERIVRGRLPTLEIIYDRWSRQFRQNLYGLLRKNAEISLGGVQPMKYAELIKKIPLPASFNIVGAKPLKSNILIVVEATILGVMVENMFGGAGKLHARVEGRDFSATEQSVIQRLIKLLLDAGLKAWGPILPLDFEWQRSEMQSQFATIATPSEICLVNTLNVEVEDLGGNIWIVFPYSSIEPYRDILTNNLQNDTDKTDNRWPLMLATQMIEAPIELRAILGEKELSLDSIAKWEIGSLIDIDWFGSVQVKSDDLLLFDATAGRNNGKHAIQINERKNLKKEQE